MLSAEHSSFVVNKIYIPKLVDLPELSFSNAFYLGSAFVCIAIDLRLL